MSECKSLFWYPREANDLIFNEVTKVSYQPVLLVSEQTSYYQTEITVTNSVHSASAQVTLKGTEIQFFPTYIYEKRKYTSMYAFDSVNSLEQLKEGLFWLIQQNDIELAVFISPVNNLNIHKKMTNAMNLLQSFDTGNSAYVRTYYEFQKEQLKVALEKYISSVDELFMLQFFIKIQAKSRGKLVLRREEILRYLSLRTIRFKTNMFKQRSLFLLFSSTYIMPQKEQIILLSSEALASIFPIGKKGLYDEKGEKIGHDCYNNPVFLNLWQQDGVRTNHNFIILGQSGQGKSNLVKQLLQVSKNVEIYLIDPEAEYEIDVEKLGASRYELAINCLFSENITFYDDIEDTLDFLCHHFTLQTDAGYNLQQLFRQLLLSYTQKEYKTLDFFPVFLADIPNLDKTISYYITDLLSKDVVEKDTIGNSKVHHFILNKVIDISNKQVNIILYETLYFIWKQLKNNKSTAKMFVIDESYFLFSRENYVVAQLLRNIVKRARKYNVSVGIITQNIIDLDDYNIKNLLAPIFDNCTYKFIFYQGDEDLAKLAKISNVIASATRDIRRLKRGECLLVVGQRYGKIFVNQTK
ncbi:MAG: helicase HerA domain-containing protein [Culicoidibacterales bacterium]